MQEKKFYVYVHKYASGPKEGKVFYVGKGQRNRAWVDRRDYNPHWQNTAKKYGFDAEIVTRFGRESCAFSFERALIEFYGRDNLVNMTDGGEGCSSIRHSSKSKRIGKKHYRYDHNCYTFENDNGIIFVGTQNEFHKKYLVSQSKISGLVSKRRSSADGWFIPEFKKDVSRTYGKNPKTYVFKNTITGKEYIGSVPLISRLLNISRSNLYRLKNGTRKKIKNIVFLREECSV